MDDANFFEANKALRKAEEKFTAGNVVSAINFAEKAKRLFPNLHGIAAHLESYRIHSAFDSKSPDWHAVLNLKRGIDPELIRKRYKELRGLVHPDKNNSSAAEGAFKLVYKAWESIYKDLGSNTKEEEEEEEEEERKCPDCGRQCVSIDSRSRVFECRNCRIIVMRGGKKGGFLMVLRDGFARVDIKGELNTKICVRGGETTGNINGLNRFHVHGGANIMLNACKGVELKGGDSIRMNDCTQINVNGTGNISFG